MPLDPEYPTDRLRFMLEDCGAPLLLTHSSLLVHLPADRRARTLCLDADAPDIPLPAPGPAPGAGADDLAYVIYTSGSTGRPKGVQVSHRALVNLLTAMRDRPGMAPTDTLLAVTTLSFDIAALELLLPLTVGARVVIADRKTTSDGERLAAAIAAAGTTIVQATPSTWRLLLAAGWSGNATLHTVLSGGEALDRELAEELCRTGARVWNMYGPTETTIWSAIHPVESGSGPVLIGRPIANTSMHVLDGHRAVVPVGVAGELYIGGAGVARGYRNRPELTAERFVPDPFSDLPTARLYRTGDQVRRRPDGSLEFRGRLDEQVKIRGHRVECGEVEAALRTHAGVREAAVVARGGGGDTRLVAYLVARGAAPPPSGELRAHLRRTLPEVMVPSAFVVLDALPLTPNGKLDRAALAAVEHRAEPETVPVRPRTAAEEAVAAIWTEVLGCVHVGVADNFFDLGGHSLNATQVISRMRTVMEVDLPLRALFEGPTVADLARTVEECRTRRLTPVPPLVPLRRDGAADTDDE